MTAGTSGEGSQPHVRERKPAQNPAIKLALELGPLALFFVTNYKFGIFPATGVLMASVLVALAISYYLTRRLPIMPVVTAIAVTVFGALTFLLHDEIFIKLKPTIVNSLFGVTLLGALAFGKPLLPIVLDSVLHLSEEGWRKLTLRWGIFFFVLAALNEIVWRTQTRVDDEPAAGPPADVARGDRSCRAPPRRRCHPGRAGPASAAACRGRRPAHRRAYRCGSTKRVLKRRRVGPKRS